MVLKNKINEFNKLYEELIEISKEILPYYDIDKVKPYSVYVWSKEVDDDFGENLFDIEADKIVFYNDRHELDKEVLPIINKIQSKLKEIKILNK